MGPFAPQKIDHNGPYEHCSILKLIEWRWNLPPMTLRDKTANNLAAYFLQVSGARAGTQELGTPGTNEVLIREVTATPPPSADQQPSNNADQ